MKTPDIRRSLISIAMCVLALSFPFWIYGTNGRFQISSVLFGVFFDLAEPSTSIQLIPELSYLLPSLLICAPCFLWLYKQQEMRFMELAGSAGLVLLVVILILLVFLPAWSVIPLLAGGYAAYVPEFIDLVPISGLVFTTMVLLPLTWRGLIHSEDEYPTRGKKVAAAVLSTVALIVPITTETFRWRGSDFNRSFFEGFSLNSATWSLSSRVDGNLWGQNTWFYYSTSSIFASLILILQILPGILLAWLVCRGSFESRRVFQMLVAGVTHILIVLIGCWWLNYTESHAGSWTITPFPALIVASLLIAGINYGYQWRKVRQSPEPILGRSLEKVIQVP